ncbi:hypothetical protein CJJ09_003898 [Candidozyma auris]|nr:hypothetical protein CJJ09_003898 [[Candida] auris]
MSGEDLELWQYCVEIPGSHVLFDAANDKLTLFLPDIDYDDVMWSGMPLSPEEALKKYDVDEVKYAADLEKVVGALADAKYTIHTTDHNKWNKRARLIKDWYEIELMRHASAITDKCHLAVMSATPIESNETHIHAEFMYHALRQGSKYQSYDPICCSGPNCSTLHYVKNDDEIDNKRSVLIDAGAEWSCYASDVTRCFPINGDWTEEHLTIYNLVLDMQRKTMEMIKPGAHWDEIHLTAHRVMIKEFLRLGIFKKEYSEEEIFESSISARFFPHGLGHVLGMDTHDVGGRPDYNDPDPKLRYLRLRRELKEGMVLTDEPGKAKYINKDVLDKYWYIGGVRIEDDLLITKDGFENFTKITSDPHEISKIIKESSAQGKERFHNVV